MNSSNRETAVLGGGESLWRARLPMTFGVHRCPQAQLLCRPVRISSLTFHCSWKHHANQLSWPSLCQSLLASFLFLLIISSPVSLTTHNIWSHSTWTWSCGSVRTSCSQHSAGMSFLALSWHIESVRHCYWGFPVVQGWRIHLLRQETQVRSLGQEDPLEEEMATLSSMLAWRIPWTVAWWAAIHVVTKSPTRLKCSHCTLGIVLGWGTAVRVSLFGSGMASAGVGWRDLQWQQRAWGGPGGAQLRLRVGRVAAWGRWHGWEPRTGGSRRRAPTGLLLAVAAWMDLSHWRLASNNVSFFKNLLFFMRMFGILSL